MNIAAMTGMEQAMLASIDITGLIAALSDKISAHEVELTALDSAIGDGDHGANMKRGFAALVAESDVLAAKPLNEALKAAGMKLVMTVGGASGPLFGTLLITLGKEIGEIPDRAALNTAFRKAVDAVAARGKSQAGQKTMLDVLYPLAEVLEGTAAAPEILKVARDAADKTIPMLATRGRASFLGERSIGHMDPGSRSVVLITETVADFLETHA